jgi:hypothetical protein
MKKGAGKIWRNFLRIGKVLFWENKIAAGLIYSGLVFNLSLWAGLILLMKKSQGVFIAHYNVFFGIDKMMDLSEGIDWWESLLVPAGGLIVWVLSVLVAIFLIIQFDDDVKIKLSGKTEEVFVSNRSIGFVGSRLLLIGAWLLQLVLLIYLLAIWLINK